MTIWDDADEEWRAPPYDLLSIPRALLRIFVLITTTLSLTVFFVITRYGQRLFKKRHKELFFVKLWGKIATWCFGLKPNIEGEVQIRGGMITSNHVNFIDIPLILSVVPGYMISKYEIRNWPVIGWFARMIGTQFIRRDPAYTGVQVASLKERIDKGDRMVIFPEATTTDGQRVIPFRSSFFEVVAKIDEEIACVQPMVLYYHAPENASVNFFGYWGEAPLIPNMWATFRSKGIKTVDVRIADKLPKGLTRKQLAQAAETTTREIFTKLQSAHLEQRQD